MVSEHGFKSVSSELVKRLCEISGNEGVIVDAPMSDYTTKLRLWWWLVVNLELSGA